MWRKKQNSRGDKRTHWIVCLASHYLIDLNKTVPYLLTQVTDCLASHYLIDLNKNTAYLLTQVTTVLCSGMDFVAALNSLNNGMWRLLKQMIMINIKQINRERLSNYNIKQSQTQFLSSGSLVSNLSRDSPNTSSVVSTFFVVRSQTTSGT